jgi:hypothetical protein
MRSSSRQMNHNGEPVALHSTNNKDPHLGGRICWQFSLHFPPVRVNILEATSSLFRVTRWRRWKCQKRQTFSTCVLSDSDMRLLMRLIYLYILLVQFRITVMKDICRLTKIPTCRTKWKQCFQFSVVCIWSHLKVAGSNTMALGLTQLLIEVSTRKSFWGVERGKHVRMTASPPSVCRLSRKWGTFDVSQPHRPPRSVKGMALLLYFLFMCFREIFPQITSFSRLIYTFECR